MSLQDRVAIQWHVEWRKQPPPQAAWRCRECVPSLNCPKEGWASQKAGCRSSPRDPELTRILSSWPLHSC